MRTSLFTIVLWYLCCATVTAQTDVGPFWIGWPQNIAVGQTGNSSLVMDASGEKVAFVFPIPEGGTIGAVGFRTNTVTAADELSVTIQTVGTDGKPTGTLYGSMTEGVVTTPTSTTTHEADIGDCTAVAGDVVAVVIEFDSYASGNLQVAVLAAQTGSQSMPLVWLDASSGYAASAMHPMLYLKYTDGSTRYRIPLNCVPPGVLTAASIQSDTTPDEVGIQYTAPLAMRLCGLGFHPREFGTTAEINIDVFNNDATPASLLTTPIVVPHDALPGAHRFNVVALEHESLTANQVITVGIFSEDDANNLTHQYFDVADAAHWGNFAQGMVFASRTRSDDSPGGGPSFTALATRKLIGGLYFDQITASGGMAIDPIQLSQ